MNRLTDIIKRVYFRVSGYSYTNLGRLFIRLFVGLMLLQFGVRQIAHFDTMSGAFPGVLGMTGYCSLIVMICIEIVCSIFIMAGFLTRLMSFPPLLAMIVAAIWQMHNNASLPYELSWEQPGYLPVMFAGIYFFLLLVGPGKISIDYFLSLHLINTENRNEEEELEEV